MQTEPFIHPSAIVETGAKVGNGSRIGPFCYVGPDVTIGENVELIAHVTVIGATTLGDGCRVFPQAVLGGDPQNTRHKGGRTTLIIGKNCTIREFVTMHTGTDTSRGETIVGDNGNFLAHVHIAHDCVVGRNASFANGATLGGHCEIGDNVGMGGLSALHQFARIGDNAFLAGGSLAVGDIIPFAIAIGNRAKLRGLNLVGLKRSGMQRAEIQLLRRAYRTIFDRSRTVGENVEMAKAEFAGSPAVMKIIDFITNRGKRHFVVPPLKGRSDSDSGTDED